MIWLNIAIGVFLSAVYVVAGIRIQQRRGWGWVPVAAVNALVYCWITAHYIWDAIGGRVGSDLIDIQLLLMLGLPALLILQMVRWSFQDEAGAQSILNHLGDE